MGSSLQLVSPSDSLQLVSPSSDVSNHSSTPYDVRSFIAVFTKARHWSVSTSASQYDLAAVRTSLDATLGYFLREPKTTLFLRHHKFDRCYYRRFAAAQLGPWTHLAQDAV